MCQEAEKRKVSPQAHDCRRNWSASAKLMEADMAVAMSKEHGGKSVTIRSVITTLERVPELEMKFREK